MSRLVYVGWLTFTPDRIKAQSRYIQLNHPISYIQFVVAFLCVLCASVVKTDLD